jgi:hypothetical protein
MQPNKNQPTIDGFGLTLHGTSQPRPNLVPKRVPQPMFQPQSVVAPTVRKSLGKLRNPVWSARLQLACIVLAGSVFGFILQIVPLGYLAVFIYCIVALIKRIPSQTTFMLAIGALLLAPLGIAMGYLTVANGFSLISFLLLTVGVVTLGIELLKKGGKHKKS